MAKKIPWEDKYKRIISQYPEVVDVNWSSVMRQDSDVFARLLGDVLKSGSRGSKPGKRPSLDRGEALDRLAKVADEDFSEFDFQDTFRHLSQGLSVRGISAKTGLGKSYVQRLLQGQADPSFATMEQIAKAFKKHPSFFIEYRIAKTLVVIDSLLRDSPETATSWYLKFSKVK
jgi:transcriptional regulator with XRE-family HTH domain